MEWLADFNPRNCRIACLIAFLALQGFLTPGFTRATEPTATEDSQFPISGSLQDQLESLSESQRQLNETLNRVLHENESLTERLQALEAARSGNPVPGETIRSANLSQAVEPQFLEGTEPPSPLFDSLHANSPSGENDLGLKSLFDSLHSPHGKSKPWYEKMSIRGYSQIRFGRALSQDPDGGPAGLYGDRSISSETGTFSIRRARLILAEDVSDHLFLYFQSDFANNPADGENTFFAQIRDLYADIYFDTDKIHRVRVGQSKIPWGFETLQSSGNRIPLDRSDAIDSGDSPNQRDLGVFYYWTPVDKQQLLKDLVDGGLKGSGNYGVFAFGMYNGQGGSELDQNRSLYTVARFTWPFQLASGQVVELSLQGYNGRSVINGAPIYPLGLGASPIIPAGVGYDGLRDQRLAATFVWYPQPWGFQTEWNVGAGPGLNNSQTAIEVRSLSGGYAMAMYKLDTRDHGIFIPYGRYQHYRGGYKAVPNAPFGTHDEVSLGIEWQIRKELEWTVEYGLVDGVSQSAIDAPGAVSYKDFRGQILRTQLQINY